MLTLPPAIKFMKKLLLLCAIACCLVSCSGPADKVAETYFKAVISQYVNNPDKSLVVVAPIAADSLKALISDNINASIEREQKELESIAEDENYFVRWVYRSKEGLEAHKKEVNDRIDALKALQEEAMAKEYPQYYLCSYNGKTYEAIATEEAVNKDDFENASNFIRKLVDEMKKESGKKF